MSVERSWLGATRPLTQTERQDKAQRAWRRIQRKPAYDDAGELGIRFKRNGAFRDAQVVRIELRSSASEATSEAGRGAVRKATIFGIQDHPTLDDTDIEKGDRVVLDKTEYRVVSVNRQLVGEIQAYCEAVT